MSEPHFYILFIFHESDSRTAKLSSCLKFSLIVLLFFILYGIAYGDSDVRLMYALQLFDNPSFHIIV